MSDILMNPAAQSGAIPLIATFIAVLVFGWMPDGIKRYAGLSVLIGFLTAYYLTFGLPPLIPKASGQKLAYIALLAGILGIFINTRRLSGTALLVTGLITTSLCVGWIGWRKITCPYAGMVTPAYGTQII